MGGWFRWNRYKSLLDDFRKCKDAELDQGLAKLSELKVKFQVRHLSVGDFTWIARCRTRKDELVLPYIVERKRMDDLSASIKDGRFHEQKVIII